MQTKSAFGRADAVLCGAVLAAVVWGLYCSLPRSELPVDFAVFLVSGERAALGLNPYEGTGPYWPNFNPPISLILFQWLSGFPAQSALWLWWSASLATFLGGVFALYRRYREQVPPTAFVWACGSAGLWATLQLGQVYMLLFIATVVAWFALEEGHEGLAGVLIGLAVALKPNFALWPALLLLAGYYRPALVSASVVGLASLLPALLYAPEVYWQWLEAVAAFGVPTLVTNGSLYAVAARLGLPVLGQAMTVVLVAVACVWVWWQRHRLSATNATAIALPLMLLASPIAWTGYLVLLLPLFFARPWRRTTLVAAALMLVPGTAVYGLAQLPEPIGFVAGLVHFLSLTLLLADAIDRGSRLAGPQLQLAP